MVHGLLRDTLEIRVVLVVLVVDILVFCVFARSSFRGWLVVDTLVDIKNRREIYKQALAVKRVGHQF